MSAPFEENNLRFSNLSPYERQATITLFDEQRDKLEKMNRPTAENRAKLEYVRKRGAELRSIDSELRAAEHDQQLGEIRSARNGGQLLEGETAGVRAGSGQPQKPQRTASYTTAMRSVDAAVRSGALPSYAAERVEALVSNGPVHSTSMASRWAALTGAEAYRGAFVKLLGDPERGHLHWTGEEAEAFRAVEAFRNETRAMSLTDSAGGYMVPMSLDPSILLTSDGSVNPLRRISRVVQTATDSWNGITSAGVSAEWKAEAAEVADATPALAQPPIPVHFGDAFTPYSFEIGMDGVGFLSELQRILLDAADQLQAAAYMNGSGTGQPTGITTALPVGSKVATATADVLVAADVVKLQNALPPRFQANARWLANLATINTVGGLENTNGSIRFPEVGSGQLLRKPLEEASYLETAGATAAAGNDNVMLYGDFSQFVIVDRIGTTIELIPNLVGANRRPTGQRGALLWFRTGSDVVVDNAFRLLTA